MKQLNLILLVMGIIATANSQSTLLWSEDFSVGLSNYFAEYPQLKTKVDTIEVVGRKNTIHGQKLLVVKYDVNGDTISTITYGADSVPYRKIVDYKFDAANHVYILQKDMLGSYKSKVVIQKYSVDGTLLWVEQIQDPADTSYTPHSLALVNDTCLFVTAYKEYDYPEPDDDFIITTTFSYLYAYNTNGTSLWQREFNPSTEIAWFANSLFVYNNTAFLFAYSNVNSTSNRLIKVDINNTLTATNTGLQNAVGNIQLTPDTNLLITAAFSRYRISKVNLNGTVIWTNYYGTNLPQGSFGDEINATIQDSKGNVYITGRHYGPNIGTPSHTNADMLTIKYDSSGSLIWQNRYEYGGNNADVGNTIILKNGQVYVGGESQAYGAGTHYDYVVLKIDSTDGTLKGVYRYDGLANGNDAITSLGVCDNGNIALTGLSYINSNYNWTTQSLIDVILSAENICLENNVAVYPNPFSTLLIFGLSGNEETTVSLYNFLGQHILQKTFTSYTTINTEQMQNGIYFYELRNSKGTLKTGKVVKQ